MAEKRYHSHLIRSYSCTNTVRNVKKCGEDDLMRMPEFNAERSIYKSTGHYFNAPSGTAVVGEAVIPQIFCDLQCGVVEVHTILACSSLGLSSEWCSKLTTNVGKGCRAGCFSFADAILDAI